MKILTVINHFFYTSKYAPSIVHMTVKQLVPPLNAKVDIIDL